VAVPRNGNIPHFVFLRQKTIGNIPKIADNQCVERGGLVFGVEWITPVIFLLGFILREFAMKRSERSAFTLVELLVVITIIGI